MNEDAIVQIEIQCRWWSHCLRTAHFIFEYEIMNLYLCHVLFNKWPVKGFFFKNLEMIPHVQTDRARFIQCVLLFIVWGGADKTICGDKKHLIFTFCIFESCILYLIFAFLHLILTGETEDELPWVRWHTAGIKLVVEVVVHCLHLYIYLYKYFL